MTRKSLNGCKTIVRFSKNNLKIAILAILIFKLNNKEIDQEKLKKLFTSSRERIEKEYCIIDDPDLPISMLIPKKRREKLKKYVKTGSKGIIIYKNIHKRANNWIEKSNNRKSDPNTGDLGALLEKYLDKDIDISNLNK